MSLLGFFNGSANWLKLGIDAVTGMVYSLTSPEGSKYAKIDGSHDFIPLGWEYRTAFSNLAVNWMNLGIDEGTDLGYPVGFSEEYKNFHIIGSNNRKLQVREDISVIGSSDGAADALKLGIDEVNDMGYSVSSYE